MIFNVHNVCLLSHLYSLYLRKSILIMSATYKVPHISMHTCQSLKPMLIMIMKKYTFLPMKIFTTSIYGFVCGDVYIFACAAESVCIRRWKFMCDKNTLKIQIHSFLLILVPVRSQLIYSFEEVSLDDYDGDDKTENYLYYCNIIHIKSFMCDTECFSLMQ